MRRIPVWSISFFAVIFTLAIRPETEKERNATDEQKMRERLGRALEEGSQFQRTFPRKSAGEKNGSSAMKGEYSIASRNGETLTKTPKKTEGKYMTVEAVSPPIEMNFSVGQSEKKDARKNATEEENVTGDGEEGPIGVVISVPANFDDRNRSWGYGSNGLYAAIEAIGGELGDPIFLRIFKESRSLEVWMQTGGAYRFLRRYALCRFPGPLGPKRSRRDGQTPEGFYAMSPIAGETSRFLLGFPNTYDRAHTWSGAPVYLENECGEGTGLGMESEAFSELYELADTAQENGQSLIAVHCFPFRLSEEGMRRHATNPWYGFWSNLKEGYDLFEATQRVPRVSVHDGNYSFSL